MSSPLGAFSHSSVPSYFSRRAFISSVSSPAENLSVTRTFGNAAPFARRMSRPSLYVLNIALPLLSFRSRIIAANPLSNRAICAAVMPLANLCPPCSFVPRKKSTNLSRNAFNHATNRSVNVLFSLARVCIIFSRPATVSNSSHSISSIVSSSLRSLRPFFSRHFASCSGVNRACPLKWVSNSPYRLRG